MGSIISSLRKWSGRSGSEILFSSLNHFPRSTMRQRWEQKGPKDPSNHSPRFLQVGHFTSKGMQKGKTPDQKLNLGFGIWGGWPARGRLLLTQDFGPGTRDFALNRSV